MTRWIATAAAVFLAVGLLPAATPTGVFRVQHRYGGRGAAGLSRLRAHDERRHFVGRSLASIDLPLGGLGLPSDTGLYFTQIGIGTPSNSYYVQVDTGSDILWVNCIDCQRCPKKSDLGLELTLYDPKGSHTMNAVTCTGSFCSSTYGGDIPGCSDTMPCQYSVLYGDGSSTTGFFVTDNVQYDQVTGDFQTRQVNASVTFGCGAQQGGDLGSSSEALDGILGFGQSNSSLLSQLAADGKVKKIFSHCLDTVRGGGIFAIGNVVEPKVKTTPLVPNMPHYNVNLRSIEVGGTLLPLPTNIFLTAGRRGTIIDSGTTLAYLPEAVYKLLMSQIFANHQDMKFHSVQDFSCFQYSGSVDDAFPEVVFVFENSLELNVYPHDYFFPNQENVYCFGFQNGGLQSKDGKDMVLLGDLVLANKLVVYDLENLTIGWADYNCSSSIKIQDDKTGAIYDVSSHLISAGSLKSQGLISHVIMLLITLLFNRLIC